MINSNFYTTIKLPCLNNFVKVKEINNHDYLDILKFIENNSEPELIDFFDILIDKNTNVKSGKITNIDKLCILLEMRTISIGNIIEFKFDNAHYKYDLTETNKKIQELSYENIIKDLSNIKFEFSLPKHFIISKTDDIIFNCISKVDNIYTNSLSIKEKDLLYKSLPASLYNSIKDFIYNYKNYFENLNFFQLASLFGEDFKLNPFNRSLIEFLKIIFSDNLMYFYELQFNLITKLNITYDHFMSMTFNEARMYIAMQNKEVKKQEEAQKKSGAKH